MKKKIIIDEKICAGKPCIQGTRLTVDFILELLGTGWSYEQIQSEYDLELEDILSVFQQLLKK